MAFEIRYYNANCLLGHPVLQGRKLEIKGGSLEELES